MPAELPSIYLQFFDVTAIIRSDSTQLIQLYDCMYRRFHVAPCPFGPGVLDITVYTQSNNPYERPVLKINRDVWDLPDPDCIDYVYDVILKAILEKIRSHFLFHAGVVAWGNRGLLLAADSGHGKTTLVLELIRRGFQFLSDEFAPLSCTEKQISPFPRSLRVRPGTLALVGFPVPAHALTWHDKLILDVDEISPGALGRKAGIDYIFLIESAREPREPAKNELTLFFDRIHEGLESAVRQMEGVTSVRSGFDSGYPILSIESPQKMRLLPQLEKYCLDNHILVIDIQKREVITPLFDQPSHLEALPRSQAALELLHQFQPSYKSDLFQQVYAGSAALFYTEVVSLLERAECYRLTIGPLKEMADQICKVVNPKSKDE